jgi:hypothetical protein
LYNRRPYGSKEARNELPPALAGGICPAGIACLSNWKFRKFILAMMMFENILPHNFLLHTHRGNKISYGPETALGKLLILLLDPGRGLTFQNTDRIGN